MKLSHFIRGRSVGWALIATLLVVTGYIDLWRGGTDLASTLLVLGYVVAIPLAIRG